MTLDDVLKGLLERQAISQSRAKDLKTSIRYLMKAVATEPPGLLSDAEALEGRYRTLLQVYFASLEPAPSPHTVRNTRNNLSFLYRTARTYGLIHAAPPRPTKRTMVESIRQAAVTSPYRERTMVCNMHYQLPVSQWPPEIREPWQRYLARRELTTRPITLNLYERYLKGLISFGLRIDQPPLTTWDELFDTQRLRRYIRWHNVRTKAPRISPTAYRLVSLLITLARESERPEAFALESFKKQLPRPEPMHNKQHPDHSISLRELEQVGLSLLAEARQPLQSAGRPKQPMLQRASRHRTALMFRLLVRVPMRVRNIAEMQLGQNLYKDRSGIWQLRFQGEELKVSQRNGRVNVFHIPFPPDLIEHLEEHLEKFRPILAHSSQETHLFLTHLGRPINQRSIGQELRNQVYFHTDGKRFYPHLIRTIWTDTYLLQTHDVSTAAYMLNDRPDTVLQRYHELRANDHIQKAHQFTSTLFGGSTI